MYAENHSYFESCCIRQRDITQIISETVFEWILPEDYVCADSDSPEHSINVTDYESDVVSPGHTALKDKVILAIESPDLVISNVVHATLKVGSRGQEPILTFVHVQNAKFYSIRRSYSPSCFRIYQKIAYSK